MRATCSRCGPAFSRRTFATGTGAGLGVVLLGGAGPVERVLGQGLESTPPAPPVLTAAPPAGESVADVAIRLGYDLDAIVGFVHDEIRYESYAGVLRGARGTLSARAGNAADQAVLLAELFTAAQIPFRYAAGALGPEQEAALTDRLTLTRDEANAAYDQADEAALRHHLGVDDVAEVEASPAPEDQPVLERLEQAAAAALDLALSAEEMSTRIITETLAEAAR